MLEMPTTIWCLKSGRFHEGIRFYVKFLEYTSGRGFFFFFCGSLQATNVNMLDWTVGGFMMFLGVTGMIAGFTTPPQIFDNPRDVSSGELENL